MRSILPFNDDWLYAPQDLSINARDDQFETVVLPHTNIVLPYHNFDNQEYQFISTYRKRFTLPEPLNGRRLYIDFDGAMISAQVTINGRNLGEHDGGYTPFSYDLTDYLREGENVLQVRLDSTERPDIPPYGGVVDYLTFGGIYREVWLRYVEPVHIENVFVKTDDVLTDKAQIECDIHLKNAKATPFVGMLGVRLEDPDGRTLVGYELSTTMPSQSENTFKVTLPRGLWQLPIRLWSLDSPEQYLIHVYLHRPDTELDLVTTETDALDAIEQKFGFREAVFKDDGFYLNGEHVKLIGLDRHQTFPYIGGAAPKRLQCKDADILKYELGLNIVRTSHYPQSPHFLDRCDEIGLLVLEEIPGWQFIGDDDWKALSLRDVEAMITRDRNHPSIVLWGVRINESPDNEALYKATNKLAHELDSTRQTGGIRNFITSQFLEDVFTYNDFSNTIIEPRVTPHLVTEFMGHMFPTKTFDQEERQIEHAVRHARIQNQQMGMGNVAGAIGWCAFDYDTHGEFGSGDRICYHGVMDIFRLPKFAAEFYRSQNVKEPMLRIASFWTHGDRSGGGNDPITVFSNCDEIELFIRDDSWGCFQPDREHYPNLPHPPFVVPIPGWHLGDLRVVGYKDGKAVVEQSVEMGVVPRQLTLKADDDVINADGSDMTRLVFKIVDKYGNRLPFAVSVVNFEIDGPGELIGDNPFPLVGGQAALYIKASKQPGVITVRASTPRLAPAEVRITTK